MDTRANNMAMKVTKGKSYPNLVSKKEVKGVMQPSECNPSLTKDHGKKKGK